MAEHKPLYRGGPDDARRNGELALYRESNNENQRCAQAIETAIDEHWDGMHVNSTAVGGIITEFGHDRVRWVLAAAMQASDEDRRYSGVNREWATGAWIPPGVNTGRFIPHVHPAKLNDFADLARKAYYQLNLFNATHCDSVFDFDDVTGHVLVLKPEMLLDEYKTPECQLFKAERGFGCVPTASGRAIFGEFLIDGEQAKFSRQDFLGVLKPVHLPEWAVEKMAEPEQEQAQNPVRIKVFQINHERDTERHCFESLNSVDGTPKVDASIYDEVYSGLVASGRFEDLFVQFNNNPPPLHRGRSMSVSDVIVAGDVCVYVDAIGFRDIEFDPSLAQKPDDLLRVVVVEPGLPAYEGEIGPDLDSMQRAVGGLIEVTYPFDDNAVIVGNEEAKLIGMEGNRHIAGQVYAGPLFIIGDDGEGGFCSLTDEQVAGYCQEFAQSEDISMEEVQADMGIQFYG